MFLFETELPVNKRVNVSLNSIYGLSRSTIKKVANKMGFSKNFKLNFITKEQKIRLFKTMSNLKLGSELKRSKFAIFKKIVDTKSIKSLRLIKGLPVRGQRTHTNAKTARKKLFNKTNG